MKYIQRLLKTDEEKATEEHGFLNEENKIKLESSILDLKRTISKLKRELESSKSKRHLSFDDIYDIECAIELSKRKLKQFRAYNKELF